MCKPAQLPDRCVIGSWRENQIVKLKKSKDLMIEYGSLRFRVSMGLLFWHNALSPAEKRDTRIHVSLGSNFLFYLFVLRKRFMFSILIKLNWRSESKKNIRQEVEMFWRTMKMFFPQRQCFSLTYHESYFTCAWAGEREMSACYFSTITVFTRASTDCSECYHSAVLRLSILF